MIRSKYVSNHIKSKKKIKYSYIVIKKRAHLLVEIFMLKIFNRKEAVNGVIFIKSIKDLNIWTSKEQGIHID